MGRSSGSAPTGAGPTRTRRREEELIVHLDAVDLGGDRIIGSLRRAKNRGTSVLSFQFADEWLAADPHFALGDALSPRPGRQYSDALSGIFDDTTPDRWGRTLLERDVARQGRARALDDWDFLTLVRDEMRMGALRFARAEDGVFVAEEIPAVPPIARLREIEDEVRLIEAGGLADAAVIDLVAPGSSLGGNRPKANFRTDDGRLWIAKFPSANDRWDVAAWEFLLNRLAAAAGIPVPDTQLLGPFLGHQHTFAGLRFDRVAGGRRLIASAMTLTGQHDHTHASYLEIARAIERYGHPNAIAEDLTQLFRRVAFNVLVGHRDDHLRNHAFLRDPGGWRLSPAYDLNPTPDLRVHQLAIDERDTRPGIDRVVATAPYYRLRDPEARRIVDEVRSAVAPWRREAKRIDIAPAQIQLMEAAFSV